MMQRLHQAACRWRAERKPLCTGGLLQHRVRHTGQACQQRQRRARKLNLQYEIGQVAVGIAAAFVGAGAGSGGLGGEEHVAVRIHV